MGVVTTEGKLNGVASLLSRVIDEKLEESPNKKALFDKLKLNVQVHVVDSGQSASAVFDRGSCKVVNGRSGKPQLKVECDQQTFVQFTMFTLMAGGKLPNFLDDNGKLAVGKILKHQLVIKGLVLHAPQLILFLRFLAVEEE